MKKFIHSILAIPMLVLSPIIFLISWLLGLILWGIMDLFDKLSCWEWVENIKDRLW
jgi:hypothetical protein